MCSMNNVTGVTHVTHKPGFGESIPRKKIQGKLLRKWPLWVTWVTVYKPFINRVHLVVM